MVIDNSFLRDKYNPDGSVLRQAQLRMLEMLVFIDEQCKKHGIEYWIDYGTLIGAARHGGFIPWDDDVDICMTRNNLLKFRQIMQMNPSHDFVLQNHYTDLGYYRCWDVLRDLKSEYIHIPDLPSEHLLKYKGLQVDIFPFEDKINYTYHRFLGKFHNAFISYPLLEKKYFKIIKCFVPFNYVLLESVLIPIGRLIGKIQPSRDYLMMSYGNQFPEKKQKKYLYPLGKIVFEGKEFNCPNDVNAILSSYYGDWQEVPSPDTIKTHGVKIIFK